MVGKITAKGRGTELNRERALLAGGLLVKRARESQKTPGLRVPPGERRQVVKTCR